MPDFRDIIERLERAEGAQRSTELARLCWQPFKDRPDDIELSIRLEQALGDDLSAIGAAVWLVERLLPGWRFVNLCEWDHPTLRARGPWTCDLAPPDHADKLPNLRNKCPHAPTPALAVLIALFRSLRDAKTEERGG